MKPTPLLTRIVTASFLSLAAAVHAAERPNIVLVMADDQGWGEMGYYGHPHLKTPNFDAMAREAVRFDRFYAAAPVCSPTRASVMTGRNPNRSAVYQWGWPMRPQEVTIAEALKKAGYRTGHFGKWHIGAVQKASPTTPGAQGFDEWVSAPNFYDLDPILSDKGVAKPFKGDSSDIAAEVAVEFMRRCAAEKQPFLAVVWFGSPHVPYAALEKDAALYADQPKAEQQMWGEITAMDRAFGRLRAEIKALGIRDNTILWYCSDNGAQKKIGDPGKRRGFKGDIYEGGLAVPGLLEWPAKVKGHRVIDVPCVTSDIYPTLLEIAGVTVENQPVVDGVSLLPLLEGRMSERPKPIGFWDVPIRGIPARSKEWMAELYASQQKGGEESSAQVYMDAAEIKRSPEVDGMQGHAAWLDGTWKLHRITGKDGGVKWELYDLAVDPKESRNLAADQPDRVAKMRGELEAWMRSVVDSHNGKDYR